MHLDHSNFAYQPTQPLDTGGMVFQMFLTVLPFYHQANIKTLFGNINP
jgi:hypothetical protein